MADFYSSYPSDGTAQSERFSRALRPGYFDIDELGLDQLLVLAKRLAGNLKYYNLDNSENGTWDELFTHDAVFVLADIANTSVAKYESKYQVVIDTGSTFGRARLIHQVASKIDSWHYALRGSSQPSVAPISAELDQLIKNSLAKTWSGIRDSMKSFGEDHDAAEQRYRSLSDAWRVANNASPPPDETQTCLDESFHGFLGAITYLKKIARTNLDARHAKRDQNPAVSLYIAFLKLYSRAQAVLNTFPARRLDFYYSQLLQARERPRQPDFVNLALTLAPGQTPALVPKGTQFLAGKDASDRDILFVSEEDLTLTDVAVRAVRTARFERDPLISPENELGCVTRIKTNEFDVLAEEAAHFPLFGTTASATALQAKIGLAIASRLFYLREGERKITLEFECEVNTGLPNDDQDLETWIAKAGSADDLAARLTQLFVRKLLTDSLPLSQKFSKVVSTAKTRLFGTSEAANQAKLNLENLLNWNPRPPEPLEPLDRKLCDLFDLRNEFRRQLGQWFARELISGSTSFSGKESLVNAAKILFPVQSPPTDQSTPAVVEEMLNQEPSALFYRLLRGSFDIRLTTDEDWLSCNNYVIAPLDAPRHGLRIHISLSPDDPVIAAYDREIHGGDFATNQPLASLQINPNAMFSAYSLLAALDMKAINLAVDVRGASAIIPYNNLGQLDSSKPFDPFGPQPTQDSYLAIGCYEAAGKPLSKAHLNIYWGGLPQVFGGFEQYYRGYSADFDDDSFDVRASILTSNTWYFGESQSQRLFTTVEQTGQIRRKTRLDLLQGRRFDAVSADVPESNYRLDNRTRSGFFRVDLSLCDNAFGHAEYPHLLTTTLMSNAKKRKPAPLPNPPYTPLINRISLDYSAQTSIRFRTELAANASQYGDQVFNQHPFGTFEVPQSGNKSPALIPRFKRDGYLLLGLSGEEISGVVSLLFDLRDGRYRSLEQVVKCDWFYLSDSEFRPMPQTALLRDTTENLTTSGIVTLDLPDDITRGNTIFGGNYFWLAVGATGDLSLCPRLNAIRTGGLTAVRQLSEEDTDIAPIPGNTISEAISATAGVGIIEQPGDSFGARPVEDRERLIMRIAERLRHKDRACQPWDYERLVLERFPDLSKVRCFANMSMEANRPAPGEVLVVVLQRPADTNIQPAQQLIVDAGRLKEIQQYLAAKASTFANISVHNAAYERVQVRCSVKLRESANQGKYVNDLNRVISDFISPWRTGGYGANFGWQIRRKDIEACIGALSYVEFITDFSMLHITQISNRQYSLFDTAEPQLSDANSSVQRHTNVITPSFPWSLALPSRRHYIQTINDTVERPAQLTGVGELEVGNTLILEAGDKSA